VDFKFNNLLVYSVLQTLGFVKKRSVVAKDLFPCKKQVLVFYEITPSKTVPMHNFSKAIKKSK
jgi:hypothetical protein